MAHPCRLFALLVVCAAGARHASQEFSKLQGVDPGAGTPLLTLLKELHTEGDSASHFATSVATWCKGSKAEKAGMMQALRRQIDEGTLMMRQIALDEERLGSELRLANATGDEKERQLQDALATGSFAAQEFEQEQGQMKATVAAASTAMRLVATQMKQGARVPTIDASLANNLMQLSQDKLTDTEKSILSAYVHDPKSAEAVTVDSSSLMPMLVALHLRLQQDLENSETEHQSMSVNLSSLADHLNSSIIETGSQVAAIRMEAAQRKRERTRLDGKVTDLSALVGAVEQSASSTELACRNAASQQQELNERVTQESNSLNALLQQIPTTDNNDPQWLMSGSAEVPTFVQIQKQSNVEKSSGQANRPGTANTSFISSPLDDIAQFVENSDSDAQGSRVHQVPAISNGRPNLEQQNDAKVSDEQRWCASIMRDANIDGAVLDRSMKRIKAKFHIVKGTMSEQEQDSTYAREQHKAITDQREQLAKLAAEEDKQHKLMSKNLGTSLRHLMKLAGDVDHLPTSAEQQRGAQQLKTLMREVENHQSVLQARHSSFRREFGAISTADQVVLRLLVDDVKHNERRLARLKTEAQFLSSLSHAKANDQAFSQQYKAISEGFCAHRHE